MVIPSKSYRHSKTGNTVTVSLHTIHIDSLTRKTAKNWPFKNANKILCLLHCLVSSRMCAEQHVRRLFGRVGHRLWASHWKPSKGLRQLKPNWKSNDWTSNHLKLCVSPDPDIVFFDLADDSVKKGVISPKITNLAYDTLSNLLNENATWNFWKVDTTERPIPPICQQIIWLTERPRNSFLSKPEVSYRLRLFSGSKNLPLQMHESGRSNMSMIFSSDFFFGSSWRVLVAEKV